MLTIHPALLYQRLAWRSAAQQCAANNVPPNSGNVAPELQRTNFMIAKDC
jgi:hypothetical protein